MDTASRNRRSGFALIDLLALLVIGLIALALLLVACGDAGNNDEQPTRTTAPGDYLGELGATRQRGHRIEAENQVRQLAQGLLMARLQESNWPADESSLDRFNRLAQRGLIEPATLAAPRDPDRSPAASLPLSPRNISYALLHSASPVWRSQSQDRRTPLLADRLIDDQRSIWADPWEGFVAWADGSAGFAESRHMPTVINGHRHDNDDLFSGDPATSAVLR